MTDLFLQRNAVREATAFLLDVLQDNKPEHAMLQTKASAACAPPRPLKPPCLLRARPFRIAGQSATAALLPLGVVCLTHGGSSMRVSWGACIIERAAVRADGVMCLALHPPQLLEINLVTNPQVADAILANGTLTHYDRAAGGPAVRKERGCTCARCSTTRTSRTSSASS